VVTGGDIERRARPLYDRGVEDVPDGAAPGGFNGVALLLKARGIAWCARRDEENAGCALECVLKRRGIVEIAAADPNAGCGVVCGSLWQPHANAEVGGRREALQLRDDVRPEAPGASGDDDFSIILLHGVFPDAFRSTPEMRQRALHNNRAGGE
jgi:hypothetical protein